MVKRNPASEGYVHYCVSGSCEYGCRDEESGLQTAQTAMRMALGKGLVEALEYRWKGMEQAAAWTYRGRALHDVLLHTLRRLWKKPELEAAERTAEAGVTWIQNQI